MNLIDRFVSYVSPKWSAKRQAARTAEKYLSSYQGAGRSRLHSNWIMGQSTSTPTYYDLELLRERSRDLNRNDAVASGATDTLCVNIVGRGLRPQSRLRADVLGITERKARDLQRQVEDVWEDWQPYADSGNRLNFDDLQFLVMRKIIEDGEILVLPVMANESWRPYSRAIELIECDRLVPIQGKGMAADDTGVEVGLRGEPLAYWIAPIDYRNPQTLYNLADGRRIPARDAAGRPKVLHIFRSNRPGQRRGIPYFSPVLTYFRDLADYLDAELVAAKVAACLAVFVTKVDPAGSAFAMAGGTEDTTGRRLQGIEPGLINYLNLGEQIQVVDPKRGGETFSSFVEGIIRMIGISLGLPYELIAKDFSKTNYSSARAALLEGRRIFTTWRPWFASQFCQPVWELVLEEAFLRGKLQADNFYQMKSEYCRAVWIGGGWGWVDPVKEVESSNLAMNYNLSTLAEEAAGQGRDWEEVLEQRSREIARMAELNLSSTAPENNIEDKEDADTEKK